MNRADTPVGNIRPGRSRGILERFAIDELRRMVDNFGNVTESFNQRFQLRELVTIHRCWMASNCDIAPDKWTQLQVVEALRGVIPHWDENERPRFPSPRISLVGGPL